MMTVLKTLSLVEGEGTSVGGLGGWGGGWVVQVATAWVSEGCLVVSLKTSKGGRLSLVSSKRGRSKASLGQWPWFTIRSFAYWR